MYNYFHSHAALAAGELCTCGKYADLECTSCRKRGYCSKACQEKDWPLHERSCREVSSRRHQRRRKSKQVRASPGRRTPLSEDTCVCGKEAEYECSGCKRQGYCSEKCQKEDWTFHDYYCRQPGSIRLTPTAHTPTNRTPISRTPISMQRLVKK